MAHGKKLSKCKILGINVTDVCKQIMQPDVPHSLRLQGILIGGVVIVFNKQQIYLLEDLQGMLRKVRAASAPEEAAVAAANTVLQKGKDRARAEAITLADNQLGGAGGAGGVGGFGEWDGMGDLADLEQHMLVLPTEELMKGFRDLDDLADPDEEAAAQAQAKQGRRRRGRGAAADGGAAAPGGAAGAAGAGAVAEDDEDLLVAPTLAPQSGTEGSSLLAGLSNRLTAGTGSHKLPTQNQPFHNNFEDDVFEAPDLELVMDPDTQGAGDAVFLALGGFGRDAWKANTGNNNNASAGPSNTKTAAGTSAGAAGGGGRAPGSRADDSMMDLFEAPSDLLLQDLMGDLPGAGAAAAGGAAAGGARRAARRAAGAAGEVTEESSEGAEETGGEGRRLQQQPSRSMSVSVPFPMVEQPQEHSVPPSPMLDEDMFPVPEYPNDLAMHGPHDMINNSQEPQPQATGSEGGFGFATAAAAGSAAAAAAAAAAAKGQKRRRTSDEDNDSASEASLSALLAYAPSQNQQHAQGQQGQHHGGHARAQQAPRRDGTGAKPARRRAGAKVTLDDDAETLVRTGVYREWTLDSRPLLVSQMAAAGPGAARNRRLSTGAGVSPTAHMRRGALGAARAATTPGIARQHAGGPGVGASMDAAIGAALAAGDSDAVAVAVLRAPAVALGAGFRSLGWAPPLVRLLQIAADGWPAAEAAAAAAGGTTAAATEDNEGDGRGAKRQRKAKTAAAARLAAAGGGAQQAAADAEPSLLVSEASDLHARETQSAERLGDDGLAAEGEEQVHMHAPLPEEEDEMGFYDEDLEMERMRAEDTPDGQRLLAHQRAALGLTPGGAGGSSGGGRGTLRDLLLPATGGRGSSRATGTTGTTNSSGLHGRESETDGSAHGASLRRGGRGSGGGALGLLRFGTGALEDLLPAIEEGGLGVAEDAMMMDEEDEDLTLPPSERATSGGNGSGTNTLRSSRLRAGSGPGSTQQPGSGTGAGGSGGEFYLRETYGQTQALPGGGGLGDGAAAYMGRNTNIVLSIFRQRLSVLAAAAQPQQAPSGVEGAATDDGAAPSASAGGTGGRAAAGAATGGLSFFSLACELTRPEAVKLFYQTLVTHTTGFVRASQAEPYGDITIMLGRHA
ncbi:hypothetical protein HXX76_010066 [Chlamydomonas incerta]|uniref:Rad21/Rec8-like protein N-terminal domain-containing protein n=1 Tax=Chlamydomonas incerta TaxID=51695 RepID=A0A835SRL5_CHLIN|nr:hypothetical protein HXX76_010066 [Chlamydomonas incerta]|eukprot:KAG2430546.1 hypothetical protein HXX76_010066 [Chlamydomonas incerta]